MVEPDETPVFEERTDGRRDSSEHCLLRVEAKLGQL